MFLLVPAAWMMWKGYKKTDRTLLAFHERNDRTRRRSITALLLTLVMLASLLIMASGPQRYITPPQQYQTGNFVFLVDVSRSMAARIDCDASTRFEPARLLMSEVVRTIPMARYGFAAFTELGFVLSELTYEQQYLQDVINNGIFVEVVPIPGSDIGNALLVLTEKKIGQPPVYAEVEDVVLLSDGDISEEARKTLAEVAPVLREAGIQVTAVGIGTEDNLPIPTMDAERNCLDGQFERAEGKEFYTHLFEEPLRFIAEETGGQYFAEGQRDELIAYLKSRLKETPNQPPVQTEDISMVFLVLATLSLFGLLSIRYF
jgi:hypothetical protein